MKNKLNASMPAGDEAAKNNKTLVYLAASASAEFFAGIGLCCAHCCLASAVLKFRSPLYALLPRVCCTEVQICCRHWPLPPRGRQGVKFCCLLIFCCLAAESCLRQLY